jgi:hypothetical protein
MTPSAAPAFTAIALLAGSALLWLFICASFLLWGARLAGIGHRTYGRAFGTIFLGGIATVLLNLVLGASAPILGTGLGILLGFCVSALVTMALFDTTFGKALAANLLAWVLGIVAMVGLSMALAFLTAIFMATTQ